MLGRYMWLICRAGFRSGDLPPPCGGCSFQRTSLRGLLLADLRGCSSGEEGSPDVTLVLHLPFHASCVTTELQWYSSAVRTFFEFQLSWLLKDLG